MYISNCKENIHCKTVTIRTKDRPWMCNEVRLFLRKRDRLFKRYKRTRSAQDKFNDKKQTGLFEMQKSDMKLR